MFSSNTKLNTHIDKISFSLSPIRKTHSNNEEKKLFSLLEKKDGFNYKFDVIKKDPKNMPYYIRMRQYFYGNTSVQFHYDRKYDSYYFPPLWCVVQDPTKELLCYLNSSCQQIGFKQNISLLELTVDFAYNHELHDFIWQHLFLKRNRGNPRFVGKGVDKSYYSGHKAKNSKTTIVYQKIIRGINHLRLELILNRPVIKRLGLDLRMDGVNTVDLSKWICFKKFNYERYYKCLEWKNRFKLNEMSPLSRSLCLRSIQSVEFDPYAMDLISSLKEKGYLHPIMPLISYLKKRGYKQPQMFLLDMPKTNENFYNLLKGKAFLK